MGHRDSLESLLEAGFLGKKEEERMEFNKVLEERRSLRAYEAGRSVSRETVEEILRAASMAPS